MSSDLYRYASMPFDNIKTRMQSKGHDYQGMLNCAMRTLRGEGVTAFWIGTTPRLARLTVRIASDIFRPFTDLFSFQVALLLLFMTK
jgi:hypothetical protein